MKNLNNVHLWKTPITEKIEFISVNSDNVITSRRDVDDKEIMGIIVALIDYMQDKGINTITNSNTGETYLFGKETKEKKQ